MISRLEFVIGLMILATPALLAQAPPMPDPGPGKTVFFNAATGSGEQNFTYVTSGMRIEGGLVKNAPYSAQAVTETAQKLADGNRIAHKTTASVYRDSDGRTRREETMPARPGATGEPAQNIFINDPVAETSFVLDTRNKVAHKMPNFRF